MPITEILIESRYPKMYRVEIEGENTGAYETVLRWEAEGYYQGATEWNQKYGLKRRVRLVVMQGDNVDEVIHDTLTEAILDTSDRDWYENADGEPSRTAPRNHQ